MTSDRALVASYACIECFLSSGTLRVGIAELCSAAGISPRTFHRYFPTKPDVIKPFFDEMTRRFGETIADASVPFERAATTAFRTAVLGALPGRMVDLMRLLLTRKEYWSVFLEVADTSEREHAQFLSTRFPSMRPAELRVLTTGVVSSSRLAVLAGVDGADPQAAFEEYLSLFTSGLFRPASDPDDSDA